MFMEVNTCHPSDGETLSGRTSEEITSDSRAGKEADGVETEKKKKRSAKLLKPIQYHAGVHHRAITAQNFLVQRILEQYQRLPVKAEAPQQCTVTGPKVKYHFTETRRMNPDQKQDTYHNQSLVKDKKEKNRRK